jgi:FAD/FMN-containing dehydrogenase
MKRVAGFVLMPGDDDFETECATFNLMTPLHPAVAVGAICPPDVQAAVRFAAGRELPIGVLTSGHQMVRCAKGAVLINMSRMNAVQIDPTRNLVRVRGGVRWQQVLSEADKYGLAPVSSTSPTVGVVGYHLGGGASPILGRSHGYASDHIQAIEIVTADGELRQVTASSEPDLFWALRGGKSNFGVVTALEFTLFPIRRFYGGGLFFAGEHAVKVLYRWREWVVSLPTEMSSSIAFLRQPPQPDVPAVLRGRFVVHIRFSSLRPRDEADSVLAPVRAVAPTLLDTIAEMPYREAPSMFMEPASPVAWVERSAMLGWFPIEAADALLALLGPDASTDLSFAELRPLGGALPDALPGRNALWSLFAMGGGHRDLAPTFERQLAALIGAVKPWTHQETAPNLLSAQQGATPDELRAIYGTERYDRLAAIKKRYDPNNLFRLNHNITPA